MDVGKFEWLVEHGRLFMLTAGQLADPLEGTAPEGELRWWQRAAAMAESDEKRRIVEHNRAFLPRMAQAFRSNCYVSCWHMNTPTMRLSAKYGRWTFRPPVDELGRADFLANHFESENLPGFLVFCPYRGPCEAHSGCDAAS